MSGKSQVKMLQLLCLHLHCHSNNTSRLNDASYYHSYKNKLLSVISKELKTNTHLTTILVYKMTYTTVT